MGVTGTKPSHGSFRGIDGSIPRVWLPCRYHVCSVSLVAAQIDKAFWTNGFWIALALETVERQGSRPKRRLVSYWIVHCILKWSPEQFVVAVNQLVKVHGFGPFNILKDTVFSLVKVGNAVRRHLKTIAPIFSNSLIRELVSWHRSIC